ncbi:MAG TPA: Z1 domain-containing protein [Candidatus Acidoferrales bacterium]|nr:Z1 domain-containing protein [Candidatus Acidoferrales bacterium]
MKHSDQVLSLLRNQISDPEEVQEISETAENVVKQWVDPRLRGKAEINGLIYGLVQSGKTGVLTVTGAMGADEGYQTLIILTSDIEPLYEQTLGRAREAFPGIDVIGKKEFKDPVSFVQRIRSGPCAVVTTKNSGLLRSLIDNFRTYKGKGLACLIIDDEADQASLNTKARKADGTRSAINDRISELRALFDRTTYLQVTATPQALFLQTPGHDFRPKFTVLSNPGADYVGGEDFFGDTSTLVREFDINHITTLAPGGQPSPNLDIPNSLVQALDIFMIAATFKRLGEADQNCAFLCHVSTRTDDHKHIVDLLRKYKTDLANKLKENNKLIEARLKRAYDDLAQTHPAIRATEFKKLTDAITFFSPGITVKLVNGETDEDVAVKSPYNLFVGGNKLGRGVTIKNLLVSYYGRNPRRPQADTVLQHARMYGYRRKDIGLLRLFLPRQLHIVFKAINKMELGLRDLIARKPDEEFRGIYIEGGLNATRKNILAPGSIGVYTGGGNYNPAQILRDKSTAPATERIDRKVAACADKSYIELPIDDLRELIGLTQPDPDEAERVWDAVAIKESLTEYAKLTEQKTGYLYVDRARDLRESRRETRGILTGGEDSRVPNDKPTLFLLRTDAFGKNYAAWWPQVRWPKGQYGFAFAL